MSLEGTERREEDGRADGQTDIHAQVHTFLFIHSHMSKIITFSLSITFNCPAYLFWKPAR